MSVEPASERPSGQSIAHKSHVVRARVLGIGALIATLGFLAILIPMLLVSKNDNDRSSETVNSLIPLYSNDTPKSHSHVSDATPSPILVASYRGLTITMSNLSFLAGTVAVDCRFACPGGNWLFHFRDYITCRFVDANGDPCAQSAEQIILRFDGSFRSGAAKQFTQRLKIHPPPDAEAISFRYGMLETTEIRLKPQVRN
jgi:hypothetical protein